ncbi:unnamed protein product [Phytomonas sp. Hart1]|nr:unnamed protein product [Phytomonas sp. Hart1]|eukprot:CCW72294.1 unnamed protein product [Phytomonas sp. isolate Hart1]
MCVCVVGSACVEHGPNNVSRWMTWLPISLKNAAKCDKWYQLQNHPITESLNANGAWEKPFWGHPRACHILSVERITTLPPFLLSSLPFSRAGFTPWEGAVLKEGAVRGVVCGTRMGLP